MMTPYFNDMLCSYTEKYIQIRYSILKQSFISKKLKAIIMKNFKIKSQCISEKNYYIIFKIKTV